MRSGPPAGAEEGGALAVFQNRPFLLLWLAQASTQIGANMVLFGLTVIVVTATQSNAAVSALILTFLVPAVLFSAVAGVYVDRIDRRLILIATNLLRAVAFIAVFFAGDHLLAILLLNIFISTVTVFFAPAEAAMIPALVPRHQLIPANGIFTLTLQGAFALGFALLGPFVVAIAGPQALILLVAALFFVAAGFCMTLPPNPPVKVDRTGETWAVAEAERAVESTFAQLREGLAYIRAHPSIRWSLVYLGIAASLVGVLGVLGPDYARTTLGLEPENWVIVVLPLGLGIVTGILFLNSYGRFMVRRRLIEVGLVLLGVLLALLSVAGPLSRLLQQADAASGLVDLSVLTSLLAVVVAIAFLTGAAYGVVAIPSQTQLQEDLPEDVRGRVFGVLFMLISIASFLPIIIVGPISDLVGTTSVLFTVALLIGASGVVSIIARGPLLPADSRPAAVPHLPGPALDPLGTAGHGEPGVPHSRLPRYADPFGLGPEPDALEGTGLDLHTDPADMAARDRRSDPAPPRRQGPDPKEETP